MAAANRTDLAAQTIIRFADHLRRARGASAFDCGSLALRFDCPPRSTWEVRISSAGRDVFWASWDPTKPRAVTVHVFTRGEWEGELSTTAQARPATKRASDAQRIIDAGMSLVRAGNFVQVEGVDGRPIVVERGSLQILHTTPFVQGSFPAPYGLDVYADARKVFSAWWEPLSVVAFKRGAWEEEIVAAASAEGSA